MAAFLHNPPNQIRSEEHTSELQSRSDLVCRLLLEKKKNNRSNWWPTHPRDSYTPCKLARATLHQLGLAVCKLSPSHCARTRYHDVALLARSVLLCHVY